QDTMTAGGFTEDGHVIRVAAETGDVVLDPAQGFLLVHQPKVAAIMLKPRVGKEAQQTQTVVQGDDDDILVYQAGRVILTAAAAENERAAMHPHHDRQVFTLGRGIDVELQTVLVTGSRSCGGAGLRTFGSEVFTQLLDAIELVSRLGWSKTQIAHRRLGIRDAAEDSLPVQLDTTELAGSGADLQWVHRLGTGGRTRSASPARHAAAQADGQPYSLPGRY